MKGIFGELDLKHKSNVKTEFIGDSKGATTSLAVHAYVLFEQFLAKFAGIRDEFSNQDGGSMCHWFENIPTSVIKTNLEDVSEHARTFTKQIGVQNVVFAMCVFQAHKMLEELTLSASLMGRIIFHDFDPKTRVEAGCNFRLFEVAFLKKMEWRLHVGAAEYINHVQDLMCPKFPDLDIDCIQFDKSRDKASAMLKMLQEASEVPDQKLCEPPQSVQDETTSVLYDSEWIMCWINKVQASDKVSKHFHAGRAICAPSYWETEDAKAAAKAARKQCELKSPW